MKKLILSISVLVALSSCKRSLEKMGRNFQLTDRDYKISCYSGGVLVRQYVFTGILNSQEHSDGYYFHTNDGTLVEISGDIIVESK